MAEVDINDNYSISASEDENEGDERRHNRLLQAISSLHGNKKRIIERSEPAANVSEFSLSEIGKEKVKIKELLSSIKKSSNNATIQKKLRSVSKNSKSLPVPLARHEADQIKRNISYNKVSNELGKWDSIVQSNREATQIYFPLQRNSFRLETVEKVTKRFELKTPLELEVAEMLKQSENVLSQDQKLTPAETKALKAMSLDEAKKRHQELQKMRALLSYQEAKARRRARIKSKKYHRILKREKLRKQRKEFDELQKTDPQAAEEKLKDLDKLRILERMTLKHKNTGKWAKKNIIRAKHDLKSRDALKEQKDLSRQLTQKTVVSDSDEEEDRLLEVSEAKINEENEVQSEETFSKSFTSSYNPWMRTLLSESIEKSLAKNNSLSEPSHCVNLKPDKLVNIVSNNNKISDIKKNENGDNEVTIKSVDSLINDIIEPGDEGIDDEDSDAQRMTIAEAFADDDVISEFQQEKKKAINKNKPEDVNLYLPGWGSWGGEGIKVSKRKRRRFMIKAPPAPPRQDKNLGNVIINEKGNEKLAPYQIKSLPPAFNNLQQFESTMQKPIGNTWNPEVKFRELTAPKVVTRLGTIIEPINESALAEQRTDTELPEKGRLPKRKQINKKQQKPFKHFNEKDRILERKSKRSFLGDKRNKVEKSKFKKKV